MKKNTHPIRLSLIKKNPRCITNLLHCLRHIGMRQHHSPRVHIRVMIMGNS